MTHWIIWSDKKHTRFCSPLPCHVAQFLPLICGQCPAAGSGTRAASRGAGTSLNSRLQHDSSPMAPEQGCAPRTQAQLSHVSGALSQRLWHRTAHPREALKLLQRHRESASFPEPPRPTPPPRPGKGICTAPFPPPQAAPAASRGGEGPVGARDSQLRWPAPPALIPKKGKPGVHTGDAETM